MPLNTHSSNEEKIKYVGLMTATGFGLGVVPGLAFSKSNTFKERAWSVFFFGMWNAANFFAYSGTRVLVSHVLDDDDTRLIPFKYLIPVGLQITSSYVRKPQMSPGFRHYMATYIQVSPREQSEMVDRRNTLRRFRQGVNADGSPNSAINMLGTKLVPRLLTGVFESVVWIAADYVVDNYAL